MLNDVVQELTKAHESIQADVGKYPPATVELIKESYEKCALFYNASAKCLKNSFQVMSKGGRLDDLPFDTKMLQPTAKKAREALKQYMPIARAVGA